MTDAECTAFLQWALPRLGRRWAGFRKARRRVAKRPGRRLRALADLDAYRRWLEAHPDEWAELDALLGIPISRFWRDRGVFESIERDVLPALADAARAAGRTALDAWSAGCASGEEPYTLAILWRERLQRAYPQLELRIVATDNDAWLLERARVGCYTALTNAADRHSILPISSMTKSRTAGSGASTRRARVSIAATSTLLVHARWTEAQVRDQASFAVERDETEAMTHAAAANFLGVEAAQRRKRLPLEDTPQRGRLADAGRPGEQPRRICRGSRSASRHHRAMSSPPASIASAPASPSTTRAIRA
jgi:hypothetical protein